MNRAAGRFPWEQTAPGRAVAVRPPVVEVGTALLFVLAALRFGLSWELPAFLFLAAAGVLLAVIDLQHRLLPNRVVAPALGIAAALLLLAAAAEQDWAALLRAGLGAVVLFAVFLVLALIAPSGLGMGDVKLAALLGLYLGWIGWGAVVLGAAGGFVVQAVVALVLLADAAHRPARASCRSAPRCCSAPRWRSAGATASFTEGTRSTTLASASACRFTRSTGRCRPSG